MIHDRKLQRRLDLVGRDRPSAAGDATHKSTTLSIRPLVARINAKTRVLAPRCS